MPVIKLPTRWQPSNNAVMQAYERLSARDRFALIALVVFLLVFGLGVGGWTLHQKANASQKAYDSTLADVFWLRSQAGNINSSPQAAGGNHADLAQQVLSQAGINATVMDSNGSLQVSFSHPQATVISNLFTQLTQQGLTIEQLQVNQPSVDTIEVQAVLK